MATIAKLSAKELQSRIVVNVSLTHVKQMRIRMWLCIRLIRLALMVGGFGGANITRVSNSDGS